MPTIHLATQIRSFLSSLHDGSKLLNRFCILPKKSYIESGYFFPGLMADPFEFKSYSVPPSTIILTILALVFVLIAFCAVYICRLVQCWLSFKHRRGVYDSTKKRFPTFTYASVRKHLVDKYGLECAICLSDFADEDVLRFLTICRHVFHKKCIDAWIRTNLTCPVCRISLQNPERTPTSSTIHTSGTSSGSNTNEEIGDSIRITISGEIFHRENRERSERSERQPPMTMTNCIGINWDNKLPKSHSTGYSYSKLKPKKDEGRFTLRFPEHLHNQSTSKRSRTKSYSSFGEFVQPRSGGISFLTDGHGSRAKKLLQYL